MNGRELQLPAASVRLRLQTACCPIALAGSRIQFAGLNVRTGGSHVSEMDTPRHMTSGLTCECRYSCAAFQSSLNVARDASAVADALEDLGRLIVRKARD